MALYTTGDKHSVRHMDRLQSKVFQADDILLQTGDADIIIEDGETKEEVLSKNNKKINRYLELGCMVLFITGNHDNLEALGKFPIVEMFGDFVREIVPNRIYQLLTGKVYMIAGRKVFTFCGAKSMVRPSLLSVKVYKDSDPTRDDYNAAMKSLAAHNFDVDIMLTHDCPGYIADILHGGEKNRRTPKSRTKGFLDEFVRRVHYGVWYFGHHHFDVSIDSRHRCLYHDVVECPQFEIVKLRDTSNLVS